MKPVASTKDYLLFKIGDTSSNIAQKYTLTLSNVTSGKYDLTVSADARMFEDELSDAYALQGETRENHMEENFEITVSEKSYLYVDLAQGSRLVTANSGSLVFNIKSSEQSAPSSVNVAVYRRANADGDYVRYLANPVSLQIADGKFEISSQAISMFAENGSYRLDFECNGSIFSYTIIVLK